LQSLAAEARKRIDEDSLAKTPPDAPQSTLKATIKSSAGQKAPQSTLKDATTLSPPKKSASKKRGSP